MKTKNRCTAVRLTAAVRRYTGITGITGITGTLPSIHRRSPVPRSRRDAHPELFKRRASSSASGGREYVPTVGGCAPRPSTAMQLYINHKIEERLQSSTDVSGARGEGTGEGEGERGPGRVSGARGRGRASGDRGG